MGKRVIGIVALVLASAVVASDDTWVEEATPPGGTLTVNTKLSVTVDGPHDAGTTNLSDQKTNSVGYSGGFVQDPPDWKTALDNVGGWSDQESEVFSYGAVPEGSTRVFYAKWTKESCSQSFTHWEGQTYLGRHSRSGVLFTFVEFWDDLETSE